MYKLSGENWVTRLSDGARFATSDSPEYPNTNPDYLAYASWISEGGVPEPDAHNAEKDREAFKSARASAVDSITVTTTLGNTFDGNEIAQGRMARAILGLQSAEVGATVSWVLADNTVALVGLAEMTEALTLSRLEQTRLWTQ